jgi:peroxin-7
LTDYTPLQVSYKTQDGLYDLAWSEIHENQLVTASGDGSLKLWDVTLNVGPLSRSLITPSLERMYLSAELTSY